MAENPPAVYILHGEDEYAITQFVARLTAGLGDSALADMNLSRLDGRTLTLEALESAVRTLPFLGNRRLVILTNPLTRMNSAAARERFLQILGNVPGAVTLVLVEPQLLTSARDRRANKIHWLEKWGLGAGERAVVRQFNLPQAGEMVGRIKELAREEGAQISNPAAVLLASLVGGNPRHAHQEIRKLMAYVNYRRPIEEEDVSAIIADQNLGDIFTLVDAIGKREGKKASKMFHRLLATQDAQSIFLMVVRQFRLLIMLKDYLERGGSLSSAPRDLAQPFFVIDKLKPQLGYFDLPGLEKIYRRLLEIDEAAKKGEMEVDIALDALIAGITR